MSGDPVPVPGTVRLISSEIDRTSRLGHVRVALRGDATARIGAFATAVIDIGRRDGVAVPASALAGEEGDWSVDVVGPGDRVARRTVTRGLAAGDDVEVRSGLAAGETVVERASAFLRTGDVVSPRPSSAADRSDQEASR